MQTDTRTRGMWGEVRLETLLEQILSPEQFVSNVTTKDGGEYVDFAIKLPGKGATQGEIVLLPIDSKFPVEDYQYLIEAQEVADTEGVEEARKRLESRVKACASDIRDKHLIPPKTTDFGILFLSFESLYTEVIHRTGLIETIQSEYRIIIAGPSTLWSILSRLPIGFHTVSLPALLLDNFLRDQNRRNIPEISLIEMLNTNNRP